MKLLVLLSLLAAAGTSSAAKRRELLQDDGVVIAIINGTDAPRGRFRYAVSLLPDIPGGFGEHFCTASLIAPRLVITAAHCVWSEFYNQPYDTRILPRARIGGYFRSRLRPEDFEIRPVVAAVVHPRFGASDLFNNRPRLRNYLNNDVALLLLDQPSVMPTLKLPPFVPKPRLPLAPGTIVTSLGWGFLSEESYSPASALQMLDMRAQSLPACRVLDGSDFGNGPVSFSWDTNSAWCATAARNNAGFCYGDSGGPLIRRGRTAKEDVLVGLASWSRKPCGNKFPYAYTDVAALRQWIDAAARELTTSLTATVLGNLTTVGFDRRRFQARPAGSVLDIFNSNTAEAFFSLKIWQLRGSVINGGLRRLVFNVFGDTDVPRVVVAANGGKLNVTVTQRGRTTTLAPGGNVRVPQGVVQYGRQVWGKPRLVVLTQPGLKVAITQPFNPRLRQRKDGVPGGFEGFLNVAATLTKSQAPVQKLGGLLAATQPTVSTRP